MKGYELSAGRGKFSVVWFRSSLACRELPLQVPIRCCRVQQQRSTQRAAASRSRVSAADLKRQSIRGTHSSFAWISLTYEVTHVIESLEALQVQQPAWEFVCLAPL